MGPNPLPDGIAGPQLLVDLLTDSVIEKAALKENWETPGGWEYEDIRAIVACTIGEDYHTAEDEERAAVVEQRTVKRLMKQIRELASPALYHEDESGLTPTPESYYATLILGLFDSSNPLTRKRTESADMGEEFADVMGVPESKVKARPFEYSKKVVMERYQRHLERQKSRSDFRRSQAGSGDIEVREKVLTADQASALQQKQIEGLMFRLGLPAPRRRN